MVDNISNPKIPVFVSSTYTDLIPYRDEVSKLLNSMGFEVHGMENFGSRTESPLHTCLNEVRLCKIFIGLLGMKYGSIDKSSEKSFIEIEYETAKENSLEILFYLINEDEALVFPKFVDICSDNNNKGARLKEFKDLIKDRHTVSFFKTPTELRIEVERDVKRLLLIRDLRLVSTSRPHAGDNLTVFAAGDQSYYIGEKIRLIGTYRPGSRIYLFLTGPHLNPFGVKLDNLAINTISDNKGTFTEVRVEPDNTWTYEWDTSKVIDLRESGTYTIFAVTDPKNKEDLSPENYSTTLITIKNPFISATMSRSIVARGDECFITGIAEGNPNSVYLWIFGANYRMLQNPINVNADASFSFKFTRDLTKKLEPGQYFVVVQHPGKNGRADIRTSKPGESTDIFFKQPTDASSAVTITKPAQMTPGDAAEKLLEMLNLPDVDDIYTKAAFLIEEPDINIDPIKPKVIGESFTITGFTNLNVDDELLIEFKQNFPSEGDPRSGKSFGLSGVCRVIRGEAENKWSFDVDGSTLVKGYYILKVTSLETGTKTQTIIEIKEN
ncbi:MAG: DUF4062 domain-containing protein [Methanoregula sp.]